MNSSSRGRIQVVTIILVLLSVSLATIAMYVYTRGTARLPQQLVRFALTAVLCMFLYQGANWARWVTIVSCSLAGLLTLILSLVIPDNLWSSILMVVLMQVYFGSAYTLAYNQSVRRYFTPE